MLPIRSSLKRRLTANIQLAGSSLMNNSWRKLIQGATTTRKQPDSPPKKLNVKHFLFYWICIAPRFQSIESPPKSVPKEPASHVSKVTVRFFSEARIIRRFRGASWKSSLLLTLQLSTKATFMWFLRYCCFTDSACWKHERNKPEKGKNNEDCILDSLGSK